MLVFRSDLFITPRKKNYILLVEFTQLPDKDLSITQMAIDMNLKLVAITISRAKAKGNRTTSFISKRDKMAVKRGQSILKENTKKLDF